MKDVSGEVRIVEVDDHDTACGQNSLISFPGPSDKFDRLVIFDSEACRVTGNHLDELANGVQELIGGCLFVEIYRRTTHNGERLARARPYKYSVFGIIPSDKSHYVERKSANFKQGSTVAKINGEKISLESEALVSGKGIIEIAVNTENGNINATIQEYDIDLPETGDVVQASTHRTTNTTATVRKRGNDYRIQLDSPVPFGGDVKVKILNDSHPIRGTVVECGKGVPSEGDLVDAKLNHLTNKVTVTQDDTNFDIELRDQPLTTGKITICITKIGSSITGEIVSYDDLPSKGEILTVNTERQDKAAVVSPKNEQYKIKLEDELVMDGEVDIRITSDGRPIKGTIDSYGGSLPEVGTVVRANITQLQSKTVAEHRFGKYQIKINNETEYSGLARVEITASSPEGIVGQVVEKTPIQDSSSSPDTSNPFSGNTSSKNDLLK